MKRYLILGLTFVIFASVYGAEKKEGKKGEHAKTYSVHHVHTNHIAIFGGSTNNTHAHHADFTLGGEYEYRLPFWHNILGAGVVGEYVFAEEAETVLVANLVVHPGFGLKLLAGPGVVSAKHQGHTERHSLWRFGIAKDFHISNFSIAPVFNLDIVNSHSVLVYGLTFGRGF